MRLLRAELAKFNRPLFFGVMFAAALFCVLLAAGGAGNARRGARDTGRPVPPCAALGMPSGSACVAVQAEARARYTTGHLQALSEEVHTAAQLDPVAAGAEAAGLMASLPGALVVALLAGGHAGGEWSGRTLKNMLTEDGRRWRVPAAKLVALWLAGAAVTTTCWAALAVAGPILVRSDRLPDPHEPLLDAATWAGSQAARALLVLAVFAMIGVLAAVITRGTIGTMSATAGVVIAMLAVSSLPGAGRWTPATWVQGWMGFPTGDGAFGALPGDFWSRFIDSGGTPPGHLLGLAGLIGTLLVCGAIAVLLFRRADVS